VQELAQAGSDLVSIQEQIDTASPAGRVVFRVLAALAEFEREQLAERTSVFQQFPDRCVNGLPTQACRNPTTLLDSGTAKKSDGESYLQRLAERRGGSAAAA